MDDYDFHFFFFSSRRRHTRFDCDWSSDVCSSDLEWQFCRTPREQFFPHGRPNATSGSGSKEFPERFASPTSARPIKKRPAVSTSSFLDGASRKKTTTRHTTTIIFSTTTSSLEEFFRLRFVILQRRLTGRSTCRCLIAMRLHRRRRVSARNSTCRP